MSEPNTNELKTTVYSAESSILKPKQLFSDMWADLVGSKDLALQLAKRDISAQYRQSYLGYLWAFITPLMNSIIWIFLQKTGVVKMEDTGIPYPVYVFSGTLLWQIFTESITSPISQINAAKGLLSKLNFPREALILGGVYKVLFNALIKMLVLIPILFYYKIVPDWTVVFFPFAILSIVSLGVSVGLFLTPIATLYSDINRALPMVMQALMYFSPVVFIIPTAGKMAHLFKLNLTTPLLLTARDFLTAGNLEWLNYFIGVSLISLILLVFAWLLFRITMPVLIERMSS